MNTKRMLVIAIVVLVFLALNCTAYATGEVYIDDFVIKNNGNAVLYDDFNDGKLDGWTECQDAKVTCSKSGCGMYLNKQHLYPAAALHNLDLKKPGIVEMTMSVYTTPRSEQYACSKEQACPLYVILYSGEQTIIKATIFQKFNEDGCRVGIGLKEDGSGALTDQPVLVSNTWGVLSMRLDCNNGVADLSLNGKLMKTQKFMPELFSSFSKVLITSGFGDGSFRND
ncbi:MAG: hypothetical protein ABFD83_05415 [Armatimonadota bacterium]